MSREYVDQLIQRVMREHPGSSPRAVAKYFEAVHQELAPLARELESENRRLREQLQDAWKEQKVRQKVAIYAENGRACCRACKGVMTQTEEPRP